MECVRLLEGTFCSTEMNSSLTFLHWNCYYFFAKAYRIGMSKHLLSKISSTIQMMHRCFVFVSSLSDMWYFTMGILSFLFYWSLIFKVTWYHNNFKELQINYLQKLHKIMLENRLLGSMMSDFKLNFFEQTLLNAHFN